MIASSESRLPRLVPKRRDSPSADQLRAQLRAAGAPTSPAELGLRLDDLKATYIRARMIRSRYTALDLAYEAGILEEIVEELFAPGGYWARAGNP